MKKPFFLLVLAFLFVSTICYSQPLYLHWTKFFGGTLDESPRDAVATSDGGIVFTGNTSSYDGDLPFSPTDSNNSYRYNLMVGKIDSNKQLTWMKVYRGSREDYGYRIIQLADGGYAVLGQTLSSDGDITWNRGTDDIWLLRLDASGNLIWQKTFGSTFSDQAISIAETSDGSFIILGRANGTDYDVPFHYGTSQFDYDFLLLKVNSIGNLIWAKTIGGTGNESSTGSIFEANGGYYMAATSNSRDNDCIDTSWCSGVNTFYDYYLFFLDTSGNVQWGKSYGGTDADAVRNAFWDNRDSTIVMVGITSSTDYMVSKSYAGVTSIWLVKTDMNGNLLWETTMGDTLEDNVNADVMPVSQGYFVGLTFEGAQYDILTHLVDTLGVVISDKRIGGLDGDMCAAVVPYRSGYSVVAYSGSFVYNDGINDNTNHTQNGQSDVALSTIYDLPLEVNTVVSTSMMKIFPNPARDAVKVVFPNNLGGILIISDASGRQVYKQTVKNNIELNINATGWAKGIYCLQWNTANGQKSTAMLTIN